MQIIGGDLVFDKQRHSVKMEMLEIYALLSTDDHID